VVPVLVYQDRDEVVPYLGFRHITGARKWGPFQKARFIAYLVTEGHALDDIEGLVGDNTQVIKKLYQQFIVYEQARALDFPVQHVRRSFSLLEVTLGQRAIKKFLGVPHRLPTGPVDYVVPEECGGELEEVLTWVFGDGTRSAVITDSREIPELARVIGDAGALETLRRTRDLDAASEMLDGEEAFLLRRLATAERAVRDAAGLVVLYSDDPAVVESVQRLSSLISSLSQQVQT
jgi:hypothetical protein